MKIIFPNDEGGVSVLYPTAEYMKTLEGTEIEKMVYIANKDLPTGTKYEIVEDSDIPTDRSLRNSWQYVASKNEKISEDL